ncbi:hypothetical protein BV898_11324 [Hypsibius exemplaris]|uniref:Uncharacterized protein n=1 Tax=Hypsibius exemplaris TaxID=2072580 RepID=A0A1W0WH27_HYPEX|nr:hypothetical protein BV898_11324 [Hypsibius exemplaris]
MNSHDNDGDDESAASDEFVIGFPDDNRSSQAEDRLEAGNRHHRRSHDGDFVLDLAMRSVIVDPRDLARAVKKSYTTVKN